MELLLTDEQRLLQDSVAKHLAHEGGVKRTRGLRGKGGGFDRGAHARMGGEGWFGILVPHEHGGLGLGTTDLALVLVEAGRALAPEPIASAALSASAIARSPDAAIRNEMLEGVLSGALIIMPAFDIDGGHVRARAAGGTTMLDGEAAQVAHAAHADGFLIEAATADGPVLCHVAKSASGVGIVPSATVDGRDHGHITLSDVRARPVLGPGSGPGAGSSVIARLYNLALVMAAAELAGVMSAALDMTVEYLKIRKQFGKPIGSFQALQHRAVNDFTSIASTRSLLFQVAAQGDGIGAAMASALKAHASGEALKVTKSAIQMHGAIGFTDEHDIGLYLKRAMWLSAYLGNEAFHRRRFANATS